MCAWDVGAHPTKTKTILNKTNRRRAAKKRRRGEKKENNVHDERKVCSCFSFFFWVRRRGVWSLIIVHCFGGSLSLSLLSPPRSNGERAVRAALSFPRGSAFHAHTHDQANQNRRARGIWRTRTHTRYGHRSVKSHAKLCGGIVLYKNRRPPPVACVARAPV